MEAKVSLFCGGLLPGRGAGAGSHRAHAGSPVLRIECFRVQGINDKRPVIGDKT